MFIIFEICLMGERERERERETDRERRRETERMREKGRGRERDRLTTDRQPGGQRINFRVQK